MDVIASLLGRGNLGQTMSAKWSTGFDPLPP